MLYAFLRTYKPVLDDACVIVRSTLWESIAAGATRSCPSGLAAGQKRLDMAAFEYPQAQEIQRVLPNIAFDICFLLRSGAILLGFPATTQDADLYVDKQRENCNGLVPALPPLPQSKPPKSENRSARESANPKSHSGRGYWAWDYARSR
jgi:hypothetical protein